MPLSISKLQELLIHKGFIPKTYFAYKDTCIYVELFSMKTADIFLLYIPSQYKFKMDSSRDCYKVKAIDMDNSENIADEYGENEDEGDIDDRVDLSAGEEEMEDHLESKYKHRIALKDISTGDTKELKSIYRQIKRLRYCVENIKYKIGILYKNYMCTISRDNSIFCFIIKKYPRGAFKHLRVVIDLETFYDKSEKMIEDIYKVRTSIYNILRKNQTSHTTMITKMIENKKDIMLIPHSVQLKMEEYDSLLSELELILVKTLDKEDKIIQELKGLGSDTYNVQSDISRAHAKSRLERELDKLTDAKSDITKTMMDLRTKKENMILMTDKIMFDNTVMFDTMIKNFAILKDF
jgi:hypothetical protein